MLLKKKFFLPMKSVNRLFFKEILMLQSFSREDPKKRFLNNFQPLKEFFLAFLSLRFCDRVFSKTKVLFFKQNFFRAPATKAFSPCDQSFFLQRKCFFSSIKNRGKKLWLPKVKNDCLKKNSLGYKVSVSLKNFLF